MLCADGNLWVVKFRNNPQGSRVLANELIATKLAEAVGLPVPGDRHGRGERLADRQLALRCGWISAAENECPARQAWRSDRSLSAA